MPPSETGSKGEVKAGVRGAATSDREAAHREHWHREGVVDGLAHWIALAGGLGYVPKAPGTAGSLGALALFFLFAAVASAFGGFKAPAAGLVWLLIAGVLAVTGVWASACAEKGFGRSDDGRIVIDEVAGQWLALGPLLWLAPAPFGLGFDAPRIDASFAGSMGALISSAFFPSAVTGFVLFRWFDISKPGPVGWAERRFKGGWGVMADDLVAGVFAGTLLALGLWGLRGLRALGLDGWI